MLNRGDHAIFSDTAGALLSVDNTFNSPFNAWLINRGLVTLPLRMRQHNASAQAIAKHLQSLPRVRFVAYPGLESHPHHAFAASQLARCVLSSCYRPVWREFSFRKSGRF